MLRLLLFCYEFLFFLRVNFVDFGFRGCWIIRGIEDLGFEFCFCIYGVWVIVRRVS